MKNILYLDSGSGYGGSAKNLLVIIRNLDRARFTPYVVVPAIGSHTAELLRMGVKLYRIPIPRVVGSKFVRAIARNVPLFKGACYYLDLAAYLLVYFFPLVYIMWRCHIHIVHGNNGIIDHFPVLFASRLLKIPVVVHISGTEKQGKLERALSGLVAHFILLNPEMKKHYDSLFNVDKNSLIDNGVDLKELSRPNIGFGPSKIRKRLGILDSETAIATLGRLVPGKGIPVLIKALKLVLEKNKQCKLIVIGDNYQPDGGFRSELTQLVRNLQLEQSVVFAGWQDNVYDFLSAVDIVAQVSTYPEGMSLAPMEAMAVEKPVIVSKNPGYERTVESRVSGLQVPPNDPVALADAIEELIEKPELARFLAVNGKKRIESLLNAEQMVAKIQKIYDNHGNQP